MGNDNWLLNKLKSLKALINFEFNSPLINIQINKKNSENKFEYDPKTKRLDLNWSALDPEDKQQLKPIVAGYIEKGNKLLETNASNLLSKLYNYIYQKKHSQVLNFFGNIIPPDDLNALESSLFLRDEFNKEHDVRKLKQDIRDIFGLRGNTICNLCTAGYFEIFFMPLYNTAKREFKDLYELIIQHSLIAVFVHENMEEKEIKSQITNKLNLSKKYGIDFIHIHGIGQHNIKNIKHCIQENKKFFDFFEKNIFENKGIIIVELLLKDGEKEKKE